VKGRKRPMIRKKEQRARKSPTVCGLVLWGFEECLSDDFYCDEAEYQASSSERGGEWVVGEDVEA